MTERAITVEGEVGEDDYDVWGTIGLMLGRLLALARENRWNGWNEVRVGLKALYLDYWMRMDAEAKQRFEGCLCAAIKEYLGIPEKFA